MADYRIDVYDTDGVLQAVLTDFTYLAYSKYVNSPGMVEFGLSGKHQLLDALKDKWQFEVWRKPDTGEWVRETTGIYRWPQWTYDDKSSVRIICNGLMTLLAWRVVGWTANYTDRSRFINKPAETIANTLVRYNATTDATTANGRLRNGQVPGLSAAADSGGGNKVDWFCSYKNLLVTLQDLAMVGGGDFDLVKTSPTTWQWRWYTGQLGTDKSNEVIFAMERGNMANPAYIDSRIPESTVAIVGGQGEAEARSIAVETSPSYDVSKNNIEIFVAATDVDTSAGLTTRGVQKLSETVALNKFGFHVLQTPACEYGNHYQLGDIVQAVNPYTKTSYMLKIKEIQVSMKSNGSEEIRIGME